MCGLEPHGISHEHTSPSISDFLSPRFQRTTAIAVGLYTLPRLCVPALLPPPLLTSVRSRSKVCSRLVTPRKSSYRLRLLIVLSRMRYPVYNPMCFSRDLTHASLSVTPKRVSFHRLTRIRLLARHTHSLATSLTSSSLRCGERFGFVCD
jgi:hypothetical protein